MGIRLTTPQDAVADAIADFEQRIIDAMIYNLKYAGEMAIKHARELPSPSASDFPKGKPIPPHQSNYMDWTANLRSSIGYVISVDGDIVFEAGFEVVKNGDDGASAGRKLAREVAKRFPHDMVLIVVAGMQYASYVADKGYDVLDSAELIAEELADSLMQMIRNQIKSAKI